MIECLCVGIGGGVGAIFRYLLGTISVATAFPVMTLAINFMGALLIGIIVGITDEVGLPPNAVLLLKTGLCGGFTTFSTFSLETLTLFENKEFALGTIYAVSSVLLCLAGLFLGKTLIKTVL